MSSKKYRNPHEILEKIKNVQTKGSEWVKGIWEEAEEEEEALK